jgi:hypothetical protein
MKPRPRAEAERWLATNPHDPEDPYDWGQGRVLDTFYVAPRHPNSHSEGAPFEYYGPLQSEEAL